MRGYPSETDNAYEVTQVVGDTADGCGLCSLASGPGSGSGTALAAGASKFAQGDFHG
jgi:hypothetical protein